MCGFVGEFVLGAGRADPSRVAALAEAVRHRGPDESGAYASPDGRLALAFHRLAVIDPPGSHQPMVLPNGAAAVAFNGEIYNYRHLRASLAREGVRFRTEGDTEVLLHLWARDGREMLPALTGMFAFALYDVHEQRLLLARDRLGEKPLWYAFAGDRIVFASEAKALLRHPAVGRAIDRQSLVYYLTLGYIPAPRTAWEGIHKLPPGHCLVLEDAPAEPQPYWATVPADPPATVGEQNERIRAAVTTAVRERMAADVPLGALLSGGIDSSIVVAVMAAEAGRAGGVRTFAAGFAQAGYDERPWARAVADHCGTQHTELLVEPDPAAGLDGLVGLYDEPFADSSALPTVRICAAAREHVTVALTGDGGDEAFGGYDRYRAIELASSMRAVRYFGVRLAGAAAALVAPHDERSRWRRLVRFARALPYPPAIQYFIFRRLFGPDDFADLLTPEFLSAADSHAPAEWFCALYERPEVPQECTRAQLHDLATYLPDDLLVKSDIASMAVGLELRAPLLDPAVVETGLGLPVGRKIGPRRGKAALREAFADMLPPEILARPKQGFGAPIGDWLRGELRETLRETLLDPGFFARGIFQPKALHGLVNDHLRGRADHRHHLWALLVLARWLVAQDG